MRNLLSFSAAAIAFAATAGAAQAEVSVSGNVAITSDYHWRGVTQSNQDFAIQGGFDLDGGNGFYAGTWMSSVDFGDATDTNVEWDFYGGFGGDLGESGLGYDVGVIYYAYPDSDDGDLDFYEVYGGLSGDAGPVGLSGYFYYDPDNETTYVEAGAGVSATDALSFDANVGSYLDGFGEYTHYNVGATYSAAGFDFDVRWYDNDSDGADDNVVFSIGRSL